VATTDDVVLEVDAAQYTEDDGPCLRAMLTGHLEIRRSSWSIPAHRDG